MADLIGTIIAPVVASTTALAEAFPAILRRAGTNACFAGKQREILVRHDLDGWLRAYLVGAGISDDPKDAPLFRGSFRNQRRLIGQPFTAHAIRRMLKRRLNNAGLPDIISPHSFRVMVVTDLLSQNVPMEDVQYLAGHSNPRTTQIYDLRGLGPRRPQDIAGLRAAQRPLSYQMLWSSGLSRPDGIIRPY